MLLVVTVAVLCAIVGKGTIWLVWRRTRAAVRRDMTAWDAQWAEEDTRIREEDELFWQAMQELDRRVRT